MLEYSIPSLLAVATGIVGSAWASGAIASFSAFSVPAAKLIPQSTAQTWAELYKLGSGLMPKVAITVALAYGYAAYDAKSKGGNWTGFLAAAGLVVAIVPFTILFMSSTNAALHAAARETTSVSTAQVFELCNTWTVLNTTRCLLPLAGAAAGLMAFLSNVL